MDTIQDRHPNFRDADGDLYLIRCFRCDPEYGKENYAANAPLGICTWCGWEDRKEKQGA